MYDSIGAMSSKSPNRIFCLLIHCDQERLRIELHSLRCSGQRKLSFSCREMTNDVWQTAQADRHQKHHTADSPRQAPSVFVVDAFPLPVGDAPVGGSPVHVGTTDKGVCLLGSQSHKNRAARPRHFFGASDLGDVPAFGCSTLMVTFRSFSGTVGVISFTHVSTASVTCSMVKG